MRFNGKTSWCTESWREALAMKSKVLFPKRYKRKKFKMDLSGFSKQLVFSIC